MGFSTGFLGGLTLTTSLVYLSLAQHRVNRLNQALILRQQTLVLNHIIEPEPPALPQVSQEVRAGLLETAKDRWNSELEHLVRRTYNTDWGVVREKLEGQLGRMWRKVSQEAREVERKL